MSSAPVEPKRGKKKRRPFETWRKVMLVGAFVLLGQALLVALIDEPIPDFVTLPMYFVGYAFLLVGFGLRMRGFKEEKARKATSSGEEKASS